MGTTSRSDKTHKPPAWGEALAHAKALLAQGVNVAIVEPAKVVEIFDSGGRYTNGELVSEESFPPPTGKS